MVKLKDSYYFNTFNAYILQVHTLIFLLEMIFFLILIPTEKTDFQGLQRIHLFASFLKRTPV